MRPEQRRYMLRHLPAHLASLEQAYRLQSLLMNFHFMEAKISALGPQPLINDYDLILTDNTASGQETLGSIQAVLRLSAHVVARDSQQLAGQLVGRLRPDIAPELRAFLASVRRWDSVPWLCPLTPGLTQPAGPLLRSLAGHRGSISALAILPDGRRVLSAAHDETLKLWDLETGDELATLHGQIGWTTEIAISADGERAVSASWSDGHLKVWDLKNGREVLTIPHPRFITSLAVTPDGNFAISGVGHNKTIKIWNLERGVKIADLRGHASEVNTVIVTPDGKNVISGSDDTTIKVFSLERRNGLFRTSRERPYI
jgi:hypothetical protein